MCLPGNSSSALRHSCHWHARSRTFPGRSSPTNAQDSYEELEIHLDPQRLVIGAAGLDLDSCGLDSARQRGGNKTVVDPLSRAERRTFIFAMPGGDPGVDESGQPVEATEPCGRGPDDPVVLRSIPFEIEVAHPDRIGR